VAVGWRGNVGEKKNVEEGPLGEQTSKIDLKGGDGLRKRAKRRRGKLRRSQAKAEKKKGKCGGGKRCNMTAEELGKNVNLELTFGEI